MRKLVFGLILAVGLAMSPAAAKADTVSDEAAFVSKINDLRASQGLAPLQVHPNLVAKARGWAATMAEAGRIWHSTLSDGVTANWRKLGENVGMGGSVDALHDAFVASPAHYANLVNPAFRHVGIGIVMNGDTIYVSEMFMQLMPAKPVAPVVSTTTTAPPPTTTTTAPKPAAAKPPAPRPAPTTTTTTTAPPPPARVQIPAPPVEPPAPSLLLVSVLERLRTFDS